MDEDRYTSIDELDLFEQYFRDIVESMFRPEFSIKDIEFLDNDEWRGQEIDESQATPRFCEFIFEYAILDRDDDIQNAEWAQIYGVKEIPDFDPTFDGLYCVIRCESDEEKASCKSFAKNVRRFADKKSFWFRQTVPGSTNRFVFAAEPSITYSDTDENLSMKINLTAKEVKGWI